MIRRLLVAGLAAAVIAGCGSGTSASPSSEPSAEVTEAPVVVAPSEETPSEAAPSEAPATGKVMASQCAAIGVRKAPKASGTLLVRLAEGTEVNVVGTVNGQAYKAGSCGKSGKKWIKIDQIDGTSVQDTYGVKFAYAAAGYFK